MKKVLFILCLIFSFKSALAQWPIIEQQETSKSNVVFRITNTGIFGQNIEANVGGGYWPRGSKNQYIFGGGIWFGAKKSVLGKDQKLVAISYDPNSGNSWMTPGQAGDELKITDWHKYKLYNSRNYNSDGTSNDTLRHKWPIWNTKGNLRENRNFGSYIYADYERSGTFYPKGTAYISDEDIIAMYNDGDLGRYRFYDSVPPAAKGYPLGLLFIQSLYSWNIGSLLQDVIAIRYTIINTSQDTLKECWVGPAVDTDIIIPVNTTQPYDERVRWFSERPELHTAIAWNAENARLYKNKGFGFMGISLLETPVIDKNGNIRKDKKSYNFSEQLGLKTFKNWTIRIDPTDTSRYDFISTSTLDGDDIAEDKRMLLATGPFHMRPGDTTYLTVAFTFAKRDTLKEDYSELITKIEAVRDTLFKSSGEEIPEATSDNPFVIYSTNTSEATLYLSLLKTTIVKVEIFNVLGQNLGEIFNGELSAQNHAIPFSTANFPSGAYYCAITSEGNIQMIPVRIAR